MHLVLLHDDALPQAKGGAAVVVEHLRQSYHKRGHSVTFVTTHQDNRGIDDRHDAWGQIISLPVPNNSRRRHRYCVSSSAPVLTALDEVFQNYKPDAVHAHNIHSFLTYGALKIARKYTEHIILTAHDTFLVSFGRVRGSAFERDAASGYPHHLRLSEHLQAVGRRYWPLRNGRIRQILRTTETRVIAISNALRQFLEANGIPTAGIVYNGTEVAAPISPEAVRTWKQQHGLGDSVILHGGRLSEDKGSEALCAAFSLVHRQWPAAQLLLAGDPDRILPFLHTLPEREREGMILAGWLSRSEMRIAYAASTLVTTPSLYLDPFNLMNIEAMAEGVPIVGTRFGGTPEVVADGETGFIVNPRDTTDFANKLLALLEDRQASQRMGMRGRQLVLERFSMEQQAVAYLRMFEDWHRM